MAQIEVNFEGPSWRSCNMALKEKQNKKPNKQPSISHKPERQQSVGAIQSESDKSSGSEERPTKRQKHPLPQNTSSSESGADSITANPDSPNIEAPTPPEWYSKITPDKNAKAPRPPPGIDEHLDKIRTGIENCVKAQNKGNSPDPAEFKRINDALHKAAFLPVNASMIRKKRLLHNDGGLPCLFSSAHSSGVRYPWYVVEDAAELYTKWWSADFNPDLFRGIDLGRKKNDDLNRAAKADKLDPKVLKSRRNGNFFGDGHLRNGQWWPTQLCAFRDGAHNSTQTGIWGSNEGAYSCVMSDGDYPNIDNGDEVFYYGTLADKGATEPTKHTKCMIQNTKNKQPVRLLRSAKMFTKDSSPYKPAEGMRYDGLYEVVSFKITDLNRQAHLFRLVRLPDQGTIRYQGPEVRPNPEELQALEKTKIDKKYLA